MGWSTLAAIGLAPLVFGCVEPWSKGILHATLLFLAALTLRDDSAWTGAMLCLAAAASTVVALGLIQCANEQSPLGPRLLSPWTASSSLTIDEVLNWSGRAAAAWLAFRIAQEGAGLRRLCGTVFLSGVTVALIGIAQQGTGKRLIYGYRAVDFVHGFFGPYFNYDHAANLMMMGFLAGLGLWLANASEARPSATPGASLEQWTFQLFLAALLAVLVWGVLATGSRGALHGLCGGTAILYAAWAAERASPRARFAALGVLVVAAAAYAAWLANHRTFVGFEGAALDGPTRVRLSLYRSTLWIVRDYPVFGIGLGAISAIFPLYQGTVTGLVVDHVHNDWLELLAELGVPTALFLAACAVFYGVLAIRGLMRGHGTRTRLTAWGAGAAVAAFALHGLVDFNFHVGANAAGFCALLGGIAAMERSPVLKMPRSLNMLARPIMVSLAILCLRPLAAEGARRLAGGPKAEEVYARWYPTPRGFFRAAASRANADPPDWGAAARLAAEGLERWPVDRDLNKVLERTLAASGSRDADFFAERAWGTK